MRAILIAEKPSLMREIQKVYEKNRASIGMDIDFLAQAGHLVGLKTPQEVDPKKYKRWTLKKFPEIYPYEYQILDKKEKLVDQIKGAIFSGNYDVVIHAGDPDGEGELLVRLVLDFIGNPLPVKRFWSNDLTAGAILHALQNLQDDAQMDSIYDAALTRQHADYQFGMNCTGVATKKMGELCKLGRVKAPIIALIARREQEIEEYVERITYKPQFVYKECTFVADEIFDSEEEACRVNPQEIPPSATVVSVKKEKKNRKAPKLFKLSTLQTESYRVLGMSGAQTLSVLQKLYEAKVTSYPRTDCEYISSGVNLDEIAASVKAQFSFDETLLTRNGYQIKKDKNYCNDQIISHEGHTAVIPTGKALGSSASDRERKLYELICRRFMGMFACMKETESLKVSATGGKNQKPVYEYTEVVDLQPGFEKILNPSYKVNVSKGIVFEEGMELSPVVFGAKEIVSKPPARFNDGSLIAALDKPEAYEDEEGKLTKFKIGTPATRASIIEECQKNGYFTKEKGAFYASSKGRALVKTFDNVPLFRLEESGIWEALFDDIRQKEQSRDAVENHLLEEMCQTVQLMKGAEAESFVSENASGVVLGTCPKCSAEVITGRYGAYCKAKCGMTVGQAMGKKLTNQEVISLLEGKKTLVKGLRSKTGKSYDAYLTPQGIKEYSYDKKDGTKAVSISYDLKIEFPERKTFARRKTAKSAAARTKK